MTRAPDGRRLRAWVLPWLGLGCLGCPALATRHTVEPVPPGRWQLSLGVDGAFLADVEQETRIPTAQADVGLRHGVVRDVDVGLRLYTFGGEVGAHWRFIDDRWDVAVAPAVDVLRTRETAVTTSALHVFSHLPVLFGTRPEGWPLLTFGPRVSHGYYLPEGGGTAHGFAVGVLGNAEWRLSRRWTLLPELSVQRTVAGIIPVQGWITQLGAGFLWRP